MAKIFLRIFVYLGCAILLLRFLEPRLLYFPSKGMTAFPIQFKINLEDIFFESTDHKKLHGWFIRGEAKSDTILFCHGNAGNISDRIAKILFFHGLGYGVFIFDYRGYGQSSGRPSEQGLYRDAKAAYDTLISRGIPAGKIVGYGESIGGAVAIDLAVARPMKALIVENTFTNIRDMVKAHYPFIPFWALASRFDSKRKMASIAIPKLIIQSASDEIVPPRLGAALFGAAMAPKEFLEIRGDHNGGFYQSEDLIEEKLRSFLSR